jgi:hypothetical protein
VAGVLELNLARDRCAVIGVCVATRRKPGGAMVLSDEEVRPIRAGIAFLFEGCFLVKVNFVREHDQPSDISHTLTIAAAIWRSGVLTTKSASLSRLEMGSSMTATCCRSSEPAVGAPSSSWKK